MKIGIIGGGVVGRATGRCFIEHVDEIRVYDTLAERRTHQLAETTKCDIVFVCLPSPQKEGSNECDLSYIEDFFEWHKGFQTNFVLRSTVPIGTTKRLSEKYNIPNLVHSPEFLTARCAITDAQMPARNIIGMPDRMRRCSEEVTDPSGNVTTINYPTQICYRALLRLYQERFPGVPNFAMSSDESEAVKLFQNSFFAVKVSLFNELNGLCEKLSLDWDTILEAMLADGRIGHSHTKVPGPDGKYGYGGSCLPKDLANLRQCFANAGVPEIILAGAQIRNNCHDRERKVSE